MNPDTLFLSMYQRVAQFCFDERGITQFDLARFCRDGFLIINAGFCVYYLAISEMNVSLVVDISTLLLATIGMVVLLEVHIQTTEMSERAAQRSSAKRTEHFLVKLLRLYFQSFGIASLLLFCYEPSPFGSWVTGFYITAAGVYYFSGVSLPPGSRNPKLQRWLSKFLPARTALAPNRCE